MTTDAQKIKALAALHHSAAPRQAIAPPGAVKAIPLVLANVTIPPHLETRHFLCVGTTGSGKSQAIYHILSAIRARRQPAIIIDHSAEFTQRYYREGKDILFNPFDERSVGWSIFNEIRRVFDFDRQAKAVIPDVPGENQDWQIGAQMVFADVLRGLWAQGQACRNNQALLHFLTKAPLRGGLDTERPSTLQALLQGYPSARLFEQGNEKQLAITLGIIARYVQPLTYLKEGDFSITDFVKSLQDSGEDRWLFLSYTDASYQAIKALFSILISCGIQAGLELSESRDRRFFFILDEFSSLDKIAAIDDALVKLRKRGGVVVAGIQSTAQPIISYGEHGAQTLLSCFGNVLMLRVADDQTAEKLSRMIGKVEIWEQSFNASEGYSEGGTSGNPQSTWSANSGWSKSLKEKDAILASEFYWLDDLNGIVRIAGYKGQVFRVKFNPVSLPLVAVAEETRPDVWLDT